MLRRGRTGLIALSILFETILAPSDARAADGEVQVENAAPAYTLVVDSDDDKLSYDAISARLAAELGGTIAPAQSRSSRAAIAIRYRGGLLTVRAEHAGDRVLERSIRAEGEAPLVQREAILLASNLARDEARELLDELSKTAPKPAEEAPVVSPKQAPQPPPGEAEGPYRAATVALFYPVATNANEENVRSPFNFGWLYSRVGRSLAFQLATVVSHATLSASGTQLATAANITGALDGAQVAAGANVARAHANGAQVAAAFNYARGIDGFQGSAGVNVSRGRVAGAQASASANIASGDTSGAQVSAGVNVATARFGGAQIASVNVANDAHGVQIGVVNVARSVKGFQVGVVNIVDEPDEAIGIVTIARDAIHPIAWGSNLAWTNAGIKFQSKHLYSVTALGFGSLEDDFDGGPGVTVAVGGHFELPASFDVEAELAYSHLEGVEEQNQALHQRILGGYSFAKHLRVFAGGGIREPVAFDRGSMAVRPEVVAGVQF